MEAWTGVYVASMILAIKCCRGEIRCYCNDASCISKGYMCKSSLDRCFSLMTPDGANSFRPFHGCAELLSGRLATACGGQPEVDYVEHDSTGSGGTDQFRSRVVCCTDDMCNYNAHGHMFPVPAGSARVSNGTMQAHKTSSSDQKAPERRHPPRPGHHPTVHEDGTLRSDVWFRAAVIAVPIAGLVILLLLIFLAVRLLRAEHVTKSSTNHSLSRILKSSPLTNHTHVTVAIADDRGDVRTLLTPPGESESVDVTAASECARTKFWTDKEFKLTPESSKVLRDFETCSPSSECSKSSLNCKCCCLARDVALTETSTDAIV